MNPIPITRTDVRFLPDSRRVIARLFVPGDQIFPDGRSRIELIVDRILAMPDGELASTLAAAYQGFADRHADLSGTLEGNFGAVADRIALPAEISQERRQLIGAYFTHEYSIESAALGNPSLVPAPDQSGLDPGEQRFVMSLRAVGEGHVSSIEFRSGVIDSALNVTIDEQSRYAATGSRRAPVYDKRVYSSKLAELGTSNEISGLILDLLPPHFTSDELDAAVMDLDRQGIDRSMSSQTVSTIRSLAASNYELTFAEESELAERVIFPAGPNESHGMEDARFVRFTHDDGSVHYYATYTAFDGFQILPQLIETPDFLSFRIATLYGQCTHNKGMALFPRMIGGRYAALARHDNENNYLMLSDEVRSWHDTERIQIPCRPWELVQIGNCGSPVETEAGWLVITHGVGPLRQYALGAILLDTEDPCRVLGHLHEPLLLPIEEERDGYVPNVVYSCGSMIHAGQLVLPYGFSDVGARVAMLALDDLLTRLVER
ncbi:MAG: glycosidase [Actinobacteria bacterium]|nr:glycosidase [Actinomycetota bacterium]